MIFNNRENLLLFLKSNYCIIIHQTQNINKKKDQNNYFRAEISQKGKQLLTVKAKEKIDFNNRENLILFLKSNFYKSKFANTYLSYEKLASAFDVNTLKLF